MPSPNVSGASSTDDTSYITMKDNNDASLVGSHCEHAYCNQLDFLPFLCQSCRRTFCLDHRSETAHKCPHEGAWARRKRDAALSKSSIGASTPIRDKVASERPCALPACKAVIGTALVTGVHCDTCVRDYCLAHRLKEDHDCKNLVPLGAKGGFFRSQQAAVQKKTALLDKLRAWAGEKTAAAGRALPKAKPSTTAQRLMAVNSLKKSAKGDEKLAAEKRVYLYVEAEAETTKSKFPKGSFFYSKDWVVGRVLDAAAKSLQIENVNNQSSNEQDKLRMFHVEGGRVLEYNEKVGAALVSGNTVVLLRGVGQAPDLIEM
ncbi:hypothetical protein TD95_003471 [Thielaviopsis punctulata]|uniref:AN1-type domain-containing protein n=1 Tax=Thielaviopsis punctulata TaxID=72032 RepID=A0A0F4ZAX5_9PEZI|nr:hypothetical protein TD95_003471 [Thielaviopsis punctulata]